MDLNSFDTSTNEGAAAFLDDLISQGKARNRHLSTWLDGADPSPSRDDIGSAETAQASTTVPNDEPIVRRPQPDPSQGRGVPVSRADSGAGAMQQILQSAFGRPTWTTTNF